MDELTADIKALLLNHPFLELTDSRKVSQHVMIKCTLNGHELPCNLAELENFTKGKKYQKLSSHAEFNYSQYEPHIVPSTKQPNQLFCKLTLRHLNRLPQHVLKHVNGKRFKKALNMYEECVRQGIEFIPIRLQQKRPKFTDDNIKDVHQGHTSKHGGWEQSSSDGGDSEDSMSDLYPSTMFRLENSADKKTESGEDDFKTDEEMEMDTQTVQKRKKVQGGGFQKKLKNNKKGRNKKPAKVQNGK
ncbi:surfeit locus protein 2 isoform X1 [Nerophis lumbriciformis]|uniref:surfeit locus protein 2 isoform X1 n=1 Tax=Nerophis lumbriciformis TaxID=546530 RepID=UPI002AE0118A|nr:surfeit locus protein 2-like isoform X1 [Nerophis lumbriciformis]